MIIREAEVSDLPQILEILNYEIKETFNIYDSRAWDMKQIKQWFKTKKTDRFPVFVAEIDGLVLGYATYGSFRKWEGYKPTVEHSIYIKPQQRKQGVGQRLMKHLIDQARDQGFCNIIAGIDSQNKNSVAFHRRFNFKEVGFLPNIAIKHNHVLNLYLMQLEL
ncbi:GNAT family N-acetyltransferase [Flavobacteriaceae bacterium]|nr:GNAT family N-acetyltransferase [Flavobacteriaceae bacterium]